MNLWVAIVGLSVAQVPKQPLLTTLRAGEAATALASHFQLIFNRGHPCDSLEAFGEMALVIEAGSKGNVSDWSFGFGKLARCEVDPETAKILAYRAAKPPAEFASQVDLMNAYLGGNLVELEGF